MRHLWIIIKTTVVDFLLLLGALTFKDPTAPIMGAFMLWPVIYMLFLIYSIPKAKQGGRADMIKLQNWWNTDAIRRNTDRIK